MKTNDMNEEEKNELFNLLLEAFQASFGAEGITFLFNDEKDNRLFELKEKWERSINS